MGDEKEPVVQRRPRLMTPIENRVLAWAVSRQAGHKTSTVAKTQEQYGVIGTAMLLLAALWAGVAAVFCLVGPLVLIGTGASGPGGRVGYVLLGIGILIVCIAAVRYGQAISGGRRSRQVSGH